MPYKTNSSLPAEIKSALPVDAQAVFRRVFNANADKGETSAFAIAWTAVKNAWEKDSEGNWKKKVKKDLTSNSNSDIMHVKDFESDCKFIKTDDSLGLVFGWAIVCKQNGQEYYDTQDDHIPEDSMLRASADFMKNSRVSLDMHSGDKTGDVVFAFPMTSEIADSLGIATQTTGLLIAIKPSEEIFKQFQSGARTGFSVGGFRQKDILVD